MGPAGPFLNDLLMHLVHVSFNFKSCVVIPLHYSLHHYIQPKDKVFHPPVCPHVCGTPMI